MDVVITILEIILVLDSIAMIVLVMLQEGNERGLSSSIAGAAYSESYAAKNAGRTREGKLKNFTRITLIAFIVLALAVNVLGALAKTAA